MEKLRLYFAAFMVLAVTMACGIRINLPVQQVNTGPVNTEEIKIEKPTDSPASISVEFGAGKLLLAPGTQDSLIQGTATYNVKDFKPKIKITGKRMRLRTGDLEINGIPNIGKDLQNIWDLKLADFPLDLEIGAGAYYGRLDLGGLSVRNLEINDGAADVEVNFSKPNKIQMENLRYHTGASTVKLTGLGNANFEYMDFKGGAGSYVLDFSGSLQQSAEVSVETGMSNLVIIVPDDVAATVVFKGSLASVTSHGAWRKSEGAYRLAGSGPKLKIIVEMSAGNLELRNP